jgi:hypothetical protein
MFGPSREALIDEHLFNIQCMIKDCNKTANRYKTSEKTYIKKAKKSLKNQDERTAKTYVVQSRQCSDLALKNVQLACNLEVVEARIKEAIKSGKINQDISKAVNLLITQLTPKYTIRSVGVMDSAFEDVSTCSETIMNAIGGVAAPSVGSCYDQDKLLGDLKEEVSQEEVLGMSILPSLETRLGSLGDPIFQQNSTNKNNITHKN